MAGKSGEYIYNDKGEIIDATGGKLAALNIMRKDPGFYARIGAKGGRNSSTGGFAANPELASRVGKIGGERSRRGKAKKVDA